MKTRGARGLVIALLVGVYRMACLRFPRELRNRWGREMAGDFQRLLQEEWSRAGMRGALRACLRGAVDVLRPQPRIRNAPHGRRLLRLRDDLRAAARSLARRPGFTLLVLGVLATGIAANTAMFAVVRAYLFRPLPYPHPERLMAVRPATGAVGWRDSGDVFERAVSWSLDGFTLVGDPGPEVVLGARVSPDFFDTYGVHLALGRGFGPGEAGPGAASVAVIGHDLWMRRFGGDPGVIGRTLRAYPSDEEGGEVSFTVIGVLPADFWYLNRYTEVIAPLPGDGPVYVGRLRPDVPPARAAAILTRRARAAGALRPDQGDVQVRPLGDAYAASVRPQLLALQAAALLVLLAAGASAGLLVLVRATGRVREMIVRRALGAGRGRLVAHLIGEGAILGVLAGACGGLLGAWALHLLGAVIEARVGRSVPGGTATLGVDGTVLGSIALLVAVVVAALGAAPLWVTGARGLAQATRGSGRGVTEGAIARRVRSGLVAAEVALALTVLTGGALLVRSALHLQSMDVGFDPTGLEAFTIGYTSEGADDAARRAAFFRRVQEGAARLPGVEAAGLARAAPGSGVLVTRAIEVEGGADPLPEVVPQTATRTFFDAVGIRPVRGRLFTEDDAAGTAPVALLSASLADRLGVEDPVGVRLRFTAWDMASMAESEGPWMTVVGVVPDVADGVEGPRPTVWLPYAQVRTAWMDLLVRRRPGTPSRREAVAALVQEIDRNTPLYGSFDVGEAFRRARAPSRFFATLLSAFSLFCLGLAMVGLYGVAAYAARQRRRDLAVRMALGAGRGSVERLFLRETLPTLAIGVGMGALGGRLLGGALQGQLHGVRAGAPGAAILAAVVVIATALLAAWLPARRVARLDVASILREE